MDFDPQNTHKMDQKWTKNGPNNGPRTRPQKWDDYDQKNKPVLAWEREACYML